LEPYSFLKTKNLKIPTLKLNDSEIILSDIDKAEHLAKYFESKFLSKTTNHSHIPNHQINHQRVYFYDASARHFVFNESSINGCQTTPAAAAKDEMACAQHA
jgi:hypothetical protein